MSKSLLWLFIWATVSKSLQLIITKEQKWANRSRFLLKRATSVIWSWFQRITLKKRVIHKFFLYVFDSFSLFLCPRANCSLCSPLSCSFLKSNGSDSLSLLFKKVWLWANCSCCSLQKSDYERFAPVLMTKQRATRAICSFSRANRSFAHKKGMIRSKNRWANFKP